MLRQLNLLPLLVIPIATLVFMAREEIIHVPWLAPIKREVLPPIVEHFPMTSAQTGKTYEIDVQIPADYAASGSLYPVIYAISEKPYLVGYKDIISPLLRRSSIPDVIVVSVSPARRAAGRRAALTLALPSDTFSWTDDVTRSQQTFQGRAPVGGNAEAFTGFLEKELIPHIDAKFRIIKDDRCVAGFDTGALFVVETALARPGLFQRYLAIAPVATWGDGATIRFAAERVNADYDPAIRLFIGIGSLDYSSNLDSCAKLVQILKSKRYQNLQFKSDVLPNLEHSNIVVPAAQTGLRYLYRNP